MFPPLESSLFALAIVAVLAYLIGSIPFGLIITRIFGLGDIRKIGSGNIGATNVLRTGSKTAALATVLLDAGKGLVPVLAARAAVGEDAAQLAGLSAFLGHLYPVWLNFKGGKGVATVLGVLVALAPFAGLTALLTWLFTFFIFRISSLSALVATIFTPFVLLIVDLRSMLGVVLIMAVFIFWKHRENMKRIYLGDEPMSVWGKSGN